MLEKGTSTYTIDHIREDMYAKIDRGDDLVFRRIGGNGVEYGRVVSVGKDSVSILVDNHKITIQYVDILDYS
jgi:hypothetical protein